MAKYFIVKGSARVERLFELNGKAYMVADGMAFKIRENLHSNSILLNDNSEWRHLNAIYEPTDLDINDILEGLEESELCNLKWRDFSDIFTKETIKDILKKEPRLIMKNSSFESDNTENSVFLAKTSYQNIAKTVSYMQSLERLDEFCFYGADIKGWALSSFSGQSEELGYYILKHCLEHNNPNAFFSEWKNQDLNIPSIANLKRYIKEKELDTSIKAKLLSIIDKC
ncbi:hypothetical protein ENBRE01_0504 [Enteropsectra breve]|nr:hypothetical protein ENBRE01_0504 [Enteropsectra breve]